MALFPLLIKNLHSFTLFQLKGFHFCLLFFALLHIIQSLISVWSAGHLSHFIYLYLLVLLPNQNSQTTAGYHFDFMSAIEKERINQSEVSSLPGQF